MKRTAACLFTLLTVAVLLCSCKIEPAKIPLPQTYQADASVSLGKDAYGGVFRRLSDTAFSFTVKTPESIGSLEIVLAEGVLTTAIDGMSLGIASNQETLPDNFPAALMAELLLLRAAEEAAVPSQQENAVVYEHETSFGKVNVYRNKTDGFVSKISCESRQLEIEFQNHQII